jgi:glycerol uptake facilitator-like aquaporin
MPTHDVPGCTLAGALGTFLLVFIRCGAASLAALPLQRNTANKQLTPADLLLIALAFGLALFISVMVVGRVSRSHVTPAVTVGLAAAALAAGRSSGRRLPQVVCRHRAVCAWGTRETWRDGQRLPG